jgi:hypothetical protein
MVAGNEQQALSVSGGCPPGGRHLPALEGTPTRGKVLSVMGARSV